VIFASDIYHTFRRQASRLKLVAKSRPDVAPDTITRSILLSLISTRFL